MQAGVSEEKRKYGQGKKKLGFLDVVGRGNC